MIASEIINDVIRHKRLKAALEEMATHELSDLGTPTISTTITVSLDAGEHKFRISIEMADENGEFAEDR